MNGLFKAVVLGMVRSAAMAGGAWLASKGFSGDAVQGVEGSIVFLAGFGFSVYDKFVVDAKITTAATTGVKPK